MNTGGGLFIFEGIEGSGKSTLINNVISHFKNINIPAIKTREPGGTIIGNKLREILLSQNTNKNHISPLTELFLFYADRAQHIAEIINPALANKQLVLCDRFIYSTIAYQAYGRGLDIDKINTLNRLVLDNLLISGVILLDIDPKISFTRVANRGELDRFESEEIDFHNRIRDGYLKIASANPDLFLVLDALKEPETLQKLTIDYISKKLYASK